MLVDEEITMANRLVKTVLNQNVDGADVYQEEVVENTVVDPQSARISKTRQVVWFFGYLILTMISLRFIFLLLGARRIGVVDFIYDLTAVFILPFRGVFPSNQIEGSFFDSASLLALVMYYLLVYLLDQLILLFSKRNTA
jgi:NADH:ubiquinone oxidoreductase subunit 6 (subunit J)